MSSEWGRRKSWRRWRGRIAQRSTPRIYVDVKVYATGRVIDFRELEEKARRQRTRK